MKCVICDSEKFKDTKVRREETQKGIAFTYLSHVLKCESCENEMSTPAMMKENMAASAEAYRKEAGLLTSAQIIKYRESLSMTQEQFSEYIGSGVASVKRWENGYVQDKAFDTLIRAKCDPFYVEEVEAFLDSHIALPPEFTGHKKFSLDLFSNLVAMIISYTNSKKYYFKALFYIDFIHAKKFGTGITGLHYNALPMGPIPNNYAFFEAKLLETGNFEKVGNHEIKSLMKPDRDLFTEEELLTIDSVISKLKSDGKEGVFDACHEEYAYIQTPSGKKISYELAKESKLF